MTLAALRAPACCATLAAAAAVPKLRRNARTTTPRILRRAAPGKKQAGEEDDDWDEEEGFYAAFPDDEEDDGPAASPSMVGGGDKSEDGLEDWGDFNPNPNMFMVGGASRGRDLEDDDDEDDFDDDDDTDMKFPFPGDDDEDYDDEAAMQFPEDMEDKLDGDEDMVMRFPDEDDDEDWEDGTEYDMPGLGFSGEGRGSGRSSDSEGFGDVYEDGSGESPMFEDGWDTGVPSADELSLLYDDFPVVEEPQKQNKPRQRTYDEEDDSANLQTKSEGALRRRKGKILETLEEREYEVTSEGIAIRALPDERAPRTGEILKQGERFTAVEALDGKDGDQRLYLRLPDGKGWVFDDEKIYPGLPAVRLVSIGGIQVQEDAPEPIKRPLVAVIGRPNVGKSTLVNRICDVQEAWGSISHDHVGTTRDRVYKHAQHTDDCGDTYMFEVVDTGGLIFVEDLETASFKDEIRVQIDVALREASAAIMVVDSTTGLVREDQQIAQYLKDVYISKGLRVILAVAKCDRLETMDLHPAEFWSLDLGEPIPICSVHRRGVWEVLDALIAKGCGGMFPMRPKLAKGEMPPVEPRDSAIAVAVVGKPNAGKSSLLNAMVGEERSIVSDIPGTTTDAIDAYLETENGKVYRFIDTAGLRKRSRVDPGMEWIAASRTVKAIKRADVALLLMDASEVMSGKRSLGGKYWAPDNQMRYISRQIEAKGAACVIVLTKWDAVEDKDFNTQTKFIQAVRNNLAGVGQWAEIVTISSKTGQRLSKLIEVIDATVERHRKRVPTNVLNEVIRDALLWRLPAAKTYRGKQGRIYYAVQAAAEPPQIILFCNTPKLFSSNYQTYIINKLRQDLGWFGTPITLEWRKRCERRAVSQAEQWLGPRLIPSEAWR